MTDVSGDFEIHLTTLGVDGALAEFAGRHGLRFTSIVLDRGQFPRQPMLTIRGRGTVAEQHATARRWRSELGAAGLYPQRVKIEAAPDNDGVPRTDGDAAAQPDNRYFEHHVKLALPDAAVERLLALTDLVTPHGARPSRNARRQIEDGRHERFVTQRCHRVGRTEARRRLDALLGALRGEGYEVVEVEQEYVVYDSTPDFDAGWLEPSSEPDSDSEREDRWPRGALAGAVGYPSTYLPVRREPGIRQRRAFDPAMKQFANAFRAGEPEFDDADAGRRWSAARTAAMTHLLRLIARSPFAGQLVLRGSVALRAWFGAAAREPGDLDFVVVPHTLAAGSPAAARLLDGLVSAVADAPAAGLDADRVAVEDIWTYERASGRRLVFPFAVPGVAPGTVQVDVVFNEELPLPAVPVHLPGVDVPVATATPELSLAWKLLWLETDMYPQGKDLYDAVLLAESTPVPLDLVRGLLRPELGAEADDFRAESVLRWSVDWRNFRKEYPRATGEAEQWQRRLALALARSFGGA
jgi:hypothetical protein